MIDHYEADVKTAQDYYPFGMIMPGRMLATLSIPGGSFSGTTQVNGYTLPVDLTLSSRSGNQPTSYVATDFIDLNDGFESGTNDDVTAYIADGTYAGGGNGSNDNAVAGGTGRYRYGFNGKENDNEVKGVGDQIDYGMRIYDPRSGRFLSIDPITKKYPELTPYQVSSNSPIAATDIDGMEGLAGPPHSAIYAANKGLYDDLVAGRNTPRVQRSAKAGGVILVAGALALDAVATKGWVTRTLFASQVFGAFYHNKASTEEGRKAQDQNSREILTDAFYTWAAGKVIGTSVTIFRGLLKQEVKYLFRGTTEGYEGNRASQIAEATPTSSDPLVATLFSIHGKNYGKGVLHIILPKDLQGVKYLPENSLKDLEQEIVLNLKPVEVAEKAQITITSDQARAILKRMGYDLPSRVNKIEDISAIQTDEFYRQAAEFQTPKP